MPVKQSQWVSAGSAAQNREGSGTAVVCLPPTIAVNWREHDFGKQRKADQFAIQDLVITSTGKSDLVLGSLQLSDPQFSIANPGGYKTTLKPGDFTTVKVKFVPSAVGKKVATLTIPSNGINEKSIKLLVQGTLAAVVVFAFESLRPRLGEKIPRIKLKIQQQGQPAVDYVTGDDGRVEIETLFPAPFDILEAGHDDMLLEFGTLNRTTIGNLA